MISNIYWIAVYYFPFLFLAEKLFIAKSGKKKWQINNNTRVGYLLLNTVSVF